MDGQIHIWICSHVSFCCFRSVCRIVRPVMTWTVMTWIPCPDMMPVMRTSKSEVHYTCTRSILWAFRVIKSLERLCLYSPLCGVCECGYLASDLCASKSVWQVCLVNVGFWSLLFVSKGFIGVWVNMALGLCVQVSVFGMFVWRKVIFVISILWEIMCVSGNVGSRSVCILRCLVNVDIWFVACIYGCVWWVGGDPHVFLWLPLTLPVCVCVSLCQMALQLFWTVQTES